MTFIRAIFLKNAHIGWTETRTIFVHNVCGRLR
jgi:hypothetical protein